MAAQIGYCWYIPKKLACQTFTKEQPMRHSLPKRNLEEGQQTVFFQIADGTARHSCSLKTKFQTQQQASRYLRQNWIRLEKMARECLARECVENGQINLVMM
jgi:hypothetical protein